MMAPRVIRGQGASEDIKKRTSSVDSGKHPLQNSWTLWFHKTERSRSWDENLRPVINFHTVEDFWGVFTHVKPASQLSDGCDYCVFKEGIAPMWEDKANRRGGRWVMKLPRADRSSKLDTLWEETLIAMIGEDFFNHGADVCGAVINIRSGFDKISIWTKDARNKQSILAIGWKLKECLGLGPSIPLAYQAHVDTIMKQRPYGKNDN
ncbi:hypothetical protein R5R35_004613 [Gryllus longicercus]|uniref:eIF-4F 25 kDa subunit n=1 Tax=Gryllus longicercus TaxID=2509291 RepID=A0AAN9WE58_9ORTH|nr:Eukaryotic translation initiation factor 4E1 [Gryllus bimaculatus]